MIEQNFQFDLVDQAKLLQKYIDQTIKVDQVRGNAVESFNGTLLSTTGGITLKREDGTVQLLPTQRRHDAAEPARRPDHAPDAGLGHRMRSRRAIIARACRTRPPA